MSTQAVSSNHRAVQPAKRTNSSESGVFILSDIRLLREGLVSALSLHSSIAVVGSAELATAPSNIGAAGADVLLLDIVSPHGLDAALPIREALPDLKIVAIAVAEVDKEVMACAEAGVSGFVSRDGSIQDVVAAVNCAVRGELVCSPRAAAMLLSRVGTLAARRSALPENGTLTRREHEIVSLVSEGLSNKEIARQLRIQNATVKNHIHSILGKLHVRRRGEVAQYLRRAGSRGAPAARSSALAPIV